MFRFNAHENARACGRIDWLRRQAISTTTINSMAGHYRGVVNVGPVRSVEQRHVRIV